MQWARTHPDWAINRNSRGVCRVAFENAVACPAEPEAAPAPTQAQGPGQRKAGESTRPDERPDPLAQLAKELGAGPVPVGAS